MLTVALPVASSWDVRSAPLEETLGARWAGGEVIAVGRRTGAHGVRRTLGDADRQHTSADRYRLLMSVLRAHANRVFP